MKNLKLTFPISDTFFRINIKLINNLVDFYALLNKLGIEDRETMTTTSLGVIEIYLSDINHLPSKNLKRFTKGLQQYCPGYEIIHDDSKYPS